MTTVSKVSLGSNKTLLFSLFPAGKRIEESWMWYCIQIDAFKGSRDNCLFIKGFLKWQWTSGSTLCAHFRWFISVHFLWDFPLLCCCFSIFHLLRFLASPELSFFGYVLKGCNICVWVSLRGRRRLGRGQRRSTNFTAWASLEQYKK